MADQDKFDIAPLLAATAPKPAPPFKGMPPYQFVGGHNDPTRIPVEGFIEAAAEVLRTDGAKLAIYNFGVGPKGYPMLREHVVDKLRRFRGIDATIEDVLITHGSNQGIDVTCDLFLAKGDVILVEEHSYQGAIDRFRGRGARVIPLKLDEQGIVVEHLASQLAVLKAEGVQPKLIYTIPTVQNPTGTILPLDRREAMIRLAREYGVMILEDECYADLVWPGIDVPPALYSLDPSCVIHIGSFSKSLAPALRLGYVVASADTLPRLIASKNRDSGTGALDQMIAAAFFSRNFDAHVAMMQSSLQEKMDVMIEAIQGEFGTIAHIHKPAGGIYVWFDLPAEIDTRTLVAPAAQLGVSFSAGPDWSVEAEAGRSSIRLCFALPTVDEIREGVAKLAGVCFEAHGMPTHSRNVARERAHS